MTTPNPGPWHFLRGGGRNGSLITVHDCNGVRVASILRQYGDNGTSCPPHDEYRRRGNAELITAAPVMLRAISDFLSEKKPEGLTRDGLRFALAAALGEHPPNRTCECLECFDYFWACPPHVAVIPPPAEGVE